MASRPICGDQLRLHSRLGADPELERVAIDDSVGDHGSNMHGLTRDLVTGISAGWMAAVTVTRAGAASNIPYQWLPWTVSNGGLPPPLP